MSRKYACGVKPKPARARDPLTRVPSTPEWLSDEAKAEWKRVLPRLVEDGVVTKADLSGVEALCIAAGRVRELEKQIQATGDVKLIRAQHVAMATATRMAAEFGLTPSSRARVGVGGADDDDDDNPLTIGRNRR